jgi:anti-sigma regulatory factor (Ser/Thr protein kinase)
MLSPSGTFAAVEANSSPSSGGSVQVIAWTYELGNEMRQVPAFVELLLARWADDLSREAALSLHVALCELLYNAIEHGNLGISYEQKALALDRGEYDALVAQRQGTEPNADRVVTIIAARENDQLVIEISDEGAGFDWRALPDPTDPLNLLSGNGRGILIASAAVDQLSFNEKGNCVTIVKSL